MQLLLGGSPDPMLDCMQPLLVAGTLPIGMLDLVGMVLHTQVS